MNDQQHSSADALTEAQRKALETAVNVLNINWEHETANELWEAFTAPVSQPAAAPIDECELCHSSGYMDETLGGALPGVPDAPCMNGCKATEQTAPSPADERAAFERKFPIPDGLAYIGNSYSSIVFYYDSSEAAKQDRIFWEYNAAWIAWQARAAFATKSADERAAYHFHRFVDGVEMAEDVLIERAPTLEAAIKEAVRCCEKRPMTVLVHAPAWAGTLCGGALAFARAASANDTGAVGAKPSLPIEGWYVEVAANGERVLCISDDHVAGLDDMEPFVPIVRTAAAHLINFVGAGPSHVGALVALAHTSADTRPTDDELWDQTLSERDTYHEYADKLANAIATHLGVDIGEHSNLNNPWFKALEALESRSPAMAAAAPADERAAPDVPEKRHATDPEQQWQQFWQEICTNADGSINLEQVKKELSDFSMLLSWVPRVYMHVTGGKVSKVNTWPSVVTSLHDEHVEELVEEALQSERDDRAASANETGAEGATIPAGYVRVPIVPTTEMLGACKQETWIGGNYASRAWNAMIAAAPQPAQAAMPALTNAMRAVITNESGAYQSADALYAALCAAAGVERPAQADARVGLTATQLATIRLGLTAAKSFIANGIELGFVRMPDADCPDPAHNTPKLIDDALALLAADPGQPEPRAEVTDDQIAAMFERVTGYSIENGRAALNDADILGFARELLEAARAGDSHE